MLRPTRYSGLWAVTVAMLCLGLAPVLLAGTEIEKQAAHQAASHPAKPAAAKPATKTTAPAQAAKTAKPAEASAIDVVKRIQTVMAKQAKPADPAGGGHPAGSAAQAAPKATKAPKPKPAPLLRWVGMPRPGDVTLTWDAALTSGAPATPGVRLVWPADDPGGVQK